MNCPISRNPRLKSRHPSTPGYFELFLYIGTSQTTQGNHIRFDSEENNDNTSTVDLNVAMLPLTHPRVLSVRGVATPRPRDTPNLSPIEPNMKNSFSAEKSTNQSNNKTNEPKGGKGITRKDSYTNRSKVMESTRIDKDVQEQVRPKPPC